MNTIKKNFSYNVIYQMLVIIIPLITAPYISRVIGTEGTGIYSYTYSIVHYFVLFAMLGINNYGNRIIAKSKKNKEELSKNFINLYLVQALTTIIITLAYITYIILFNNKYISIALAQILYLFAALFDISWFFFGLEKFRITVTRNIIIKIITTICIFIFVKSKNDLILYVLIMAVSSFINQVYLWLFVKKEIVFVRPTFKEMKKHLKPNLILFIPVIAVSLYKMMDKIMLGNMSNMSEVGIYEYAERIQSMPQGIINALGTVMLPRISALVSNGEKEKSMEYLDKSMRFVLMLSIPICFGIIVVAPNFVELFLGEDFIKTGNVLQCLIITIVFISWANVIRTQYLIPNEKDKEFILSVLLGAIVNLILNVMLIPIYQSIGAAIATIFAEFAVMIYQTIVVRKKINITKYLSYLAIYTIKGAIMFICVFLIQYMIRDKILLTVVQVILRNTNLCYLKHENCLSRV